MNTAPDRGFVSTDQVLQQIVGLLGQARLDEATSLYCRCHEDIGYPLINQTKANETLQQACANMLYRARDFPKAALVCENLCEYDKAAALYERCDDFYLAAEMYSKVGNTQRAAEMFEKNQSWQQAAELFIQAGDYERAAANFERSVNNYLAGKLYYECGRFQKAMELLQRVGNDAHEFFEATEMIGQILAQNGYPELAARKLLTVLAGEPVGERTVSLYYQLAALYTQTGHTDAARTTYQDILNYDFNYADVQQKLAALDAPKAAAGPAPVELVALPEVPAPDVVLGVGDRPGPTHTTQIVSVMEGFDFLKNLPLFADLSLAEIKAFYNLCKTPTFRPGDVLVEQGVPGRSMHIIKDGGVNVFLVDGDRQTPLATLGPGEYVGEMSLIDNAETSAQVVAAIDTTTFEIDREAFERFLFANDHMALRVYRVLVQTLCTRLRKTAGQLKPG